jgi:8-oxo-dGTP pyrophosphatase MutT (NUDIX family)
MIKIEKTCPIVLRKCDSQFELLAFEHPLAGRQFVKGTIEPGETAACAAVRELEEESGLVPTKQMDFLGVCQIGKPQRGWHFFQYLSSGLPDTWTHKTADDGGHTFAFFWQPLGAPLDKTWHPIFHQAFAFFAPRVTWR